MSDTPDEKKNNKGFPAIFSNPNFNKASELPTGLNASGGLIYEDKTVLSNVFKGVEYSQQIVKGYNDAVLKLGESATSSLFRQMDNDGGMTKLKEQSSYLLSNMYNPTASMDFSKETERVLNDLKETGVFNYDFKADSVSSLLYVGALKDNVTGNLSLYNSQIELTKNLFVDSIPGIDISSFAGLNASNYLDNKRLSNLDIISGITFSHAISVTGSTGELANVYKQLEAVLEANKHLKEVIKSKDIIISLKDKLGDEKPLVNIQEIQEKDKSGRFKMSDFDEIVENVVNAIFIDIMGLTPKAALVLFTMLWCTYKVPVEAFKEGELGNIWHEVIGDKDNSENSTVYNIEVNVTKTENTQDFTIKRTKVFWKNSSKSDSVGYFKTDTEVEILDIKDGWCLVKGKGFETIIETVQDRKKKNRKPGVTIKSSELTGWVQKPCLKKFK